MQPIYLTIGLHPLMIIPDTQVHPGGHAVVTNTYHIYQQSGLSANREVYDQEDKQGLNPNDDPDYLGHLVFEIPDKLFNYFPEGLHRLDGEEMTELVEQLSHYRDNQGFWRDS